MYVRQGHIDAGGHGAETCPVALGLRDAGYARPMCAYFPARSFTRIVIGAYQRVEYRLTSSTLLKRIRAWDVERTMSPFYFLMPA